MACGLNSLLQTTLGGECSVAIPVSSTLKILLGLFHAQSLGKNLRSGESLQLSNNWFYGMLKRWPELKLVKPQKLSMSRAKAASGW
jgi:hypothetical protein